MKDQAMSMLDSARASRAWRAMTRPPFMSTQAGPVAVLPSGEIVSVRKGPAGSWTVSRWPESRILLLFVEALDGGLKQNAVGGTGSSRERRSQSGLGSP